jgi:hypothetical protein
MLLEKLINSFYGEAISKKTYFIRKAEKQLSELEIESPPNTTKATCP